MAPLLVLLAEYGAEELTGGAGGRGGARSVVLSELPMKILSSRPFAPIKRDGGSSTRRPSSATHSSPA